MWAYVTQHKFVCSTHSGGGVVTKPCLTLVTPWTVARQVSLAMGFPSQEYWSGLPFPFPGALPNLRIELRSPAFQVDSSLTSYQGSFSTHSEAKQIETLEFVTEERLSQGWARMDGSCSKHPELPGKFWQGIFEGQVREGRPRICDQLVHSSLVDVEIAGWLASILSCQKVWGLCAHGHQVVNFFHLVVVFNLWKSHEICMRWYFLGTSERSYSRGYGAGVCPGEAT